MTIELEIFDNTRAGEWDRLVEQSPQGTLFHSWDWLKITRDQTGSRLYPVVVFKDSKPLGLIPIFCQKLGLFRMVFSPPPHAGLFYLGPVLIKDYGKKQDRMESDYLDFHDAVEGFLKNEINPDYVNISLPPALVDPRPYSWAGYAIEPLYDYVTDLSTGEDYLFASLAAKKRQDIKRTQRKGVTVRTGEAGEYKKVIDLMDDRYGDQDKLITIPGEYFSRIYEKFQKNIKVMLAEYEGEPVTGLIDLHYRDTIYSWIGNPKPRVQNLGSPNTLIAWEAIRSGCAEGYTSYVTMSAAGNRRLHHYYSSQFESSLQIRFRAKKTTLLTSILETGYTSFVKPFHGKAKSAMKKIRSSS